jgi:opacity protein-like surface antigen
MKKLWFYAPLLFCVPLAHAQSAIDFNVNFGSAFDSSSNSGIDNANSLSNAFGGCALNSGDPFCEKTPSLSGFMLGFGGDIMFKEHFGFGAEVNFQPATSSYGPLNYRQTFYDFNGIYEPIIKKRVIVQLQAGVGGAKTSFGFSQSSCVGTNVVCSNQNEAVGSATHFQVHLGAGVQIAITEHLFLRPEFDVHYVPNLTNQFGSDWVPEATIAVGYHFGSR